MSKTCFLVVDFGCLKMQACTFIMNQPIGNSEIIKMKALIQSIKCWWNREWSDWTFLTTENIYNSKHQRTGSLYVYRRVSNDGLVEFKKHFI